MEINLNDRIAFESRHNGPNAPEINSMLGALGLNSIEELVAQTIPGKIRLKEDIQLPAPLTEFEYLKKIKEIANQNKVFNSFIGQGYYNCVVPSVIQRNILENPGWYTAYTPYQAEIAQGRLEALINFQTLVVDLTGMEIANASLLDEGTASAEAISMLHATRGREKKNANKFFVDQRVFPQTLEVIKTRTQPLGIEVVIGKIESIDLTEEGLFGVFFQYPDNHGELFDRESFVTSAKEQSVAVVVASDLLSLCMLKSPGEWGVDVVVGTSQRFGVPMGFGGPHAAFFATREDFKRYIPGRIIGVSKDSEGNPAYRMALQTREQHIKRERATSNICTAQVLLAVMSSMYAVYHGPEGLKRISARVHGLAKVTASALAAMGLNNENNHYFDTLRFQLDREKLTELKRLSESKDINFRYLESEVLISFDETHSLKDANLVVGLFAAVLNQASSDVAEKASIELPGGLTRTSPILTHPVFSENQTEHELLRYMKRLENKDLSLVHSMISLGSCTMKLNATTEMIPVTWAEFGQIHPFAPENQTMGYKKLILELHDWLTAITGFSAVSFQPNSGAQGEFAGLMVIRSYHHSRGDHHRNVTLIPSSAHGTNPASAVMAGMKVVIVKCDDNGNIDLEDLRIKAEENGKELSALMVTYPSTHGVFEEHIVEVCEIIHSYGGQVYMDGANMNAQVGLTSPAMIGADVCHLNLHKTFCIPHGGGGPGMGPIGVVSHLAPFLPGLFSGDDTVTISSAPFGSASILPISHAYIAMMGAEGIRKATELAILNANYIGHRLKDHYPILYANEKGRNAHELIIDCRDFKKAGVEVEDIAKRLMDYGYHAPTVSFPVPGTMMIEPTESETQGEMDRFCDVMISIRMEIQDVLSGQVDSQNNVLKNAPHTQRTVLSENWDRPYSREQAAFPMKSLKFNKFWPTVSRIDSAYGDRNLMCSCIPVSEYEDADLTNA